MLAKWLARWLANKVGTRRSTRKATDEAPRLATRLAQNTLATQGVKLALHKSYLFVVELLKKIKFVEAVCLMAVASFRCF